MPIIDPSAMRWASLPLYTPYRLRFFRDLSDPATRIREVAGIVARVTGGG